MSKSLQEQLLILGLARERPRGKRPVKSRGKPRGRPVKGDTQGKTRGRAGQRKAVAGSGGKDRESEMNLARAYALRKTEEQQQADAQREAKRQEAQRRRQLNKAISAIVKAHRLNDPKAEVPRNFMYKGRIRKIHLTAEQLKSLKQGDLGVVYLSGGYHLLAAEQVEAIRQLSAEHVPDLGGGLDDDEDHPVPDDLIW